jgi:outer membrane lipoprotein carrier protein
MRIHKFIFSVVLFLIPLAGQLLLLPAQCIAGGLADRVQAAYKDVRDMKGEFTQKSFIKDLDKTQHFKGDFAIKFPSKMRYRYKSGSQDEVVISGSEIIIYQKVQKQALKGKFNSATYGAAPVALLSGLGNINRDFFETENGNSLFLKPKQPAGAVKSIEVEVSEAPFPVKGFKINDVYGNTVEITLKDVRLNTGVTDKSLEFTPPKGVNVYEFKP